MAPATPPTPDTDAPELWMRSPRTPAQSMTPAPPTSPSPRSHSHAATADQRRDLQDRMQKMRQEMEKLREEMSRLRQELGGESGGTR